ncbi:hypothetical protein N7486_004594 [Penicillium sp. IBT 16267x]|nr:hypothetical protein N7486_004594 [Penicillium sp. IBT 16267x]
MHLPHISVLAVLASCSIPAAAHVPHQSRDQGTCKKTTVAILGGGVAGITAAQALSNASVHDFAILEYRDTIGGRAWHKPFGKDPKTGNPYTIEMGANWVQGLGNPGGPHNPIWTLAQKYNLKTHYSDYDNASTYNANGYSDYSHLLTEYDNAYDIANKKAGEILTKNLQDQTAQSGLTLAGWSPGKHMEAQAVDWWKWDFEDNFNTLESSLVFGCAGDNLTSNVFSDHDNFVTDQRGFNTIFKGEAATFLKQNDPRLHLNTKITKITYSDDGVTIHNKDGSCITAAYAICTFSLGVLQSDEVKFTPTLPEWKQTAIQKFTMGTYTKIFMQFNETFWPTNTQYFLYADAGLRGWYPIFQSLSMPQFLPDSNERQSDEQTKEEIMDVLRKMFPEKTIPEPTSFLYPRWSTEPWAHGSYSNWPPATTLEMHENLRANTGRLWFAGEATSPTYFGFVHGAWFEGRDGGRRIAAILQDQCIHANATKLRECGARKHYEILHGTSPFADYSAVNGWTADSFYDSNSD